MGHAALVIDIMYSAVIHDREGAVIKRVGGNGAVSRYDVEPLGEEEVDLVDMLFERRVAGRVVFNVIGGADALAGVEGNFGGLQARLAVRSAPERGISLGGVALRGV